MQNFKFDEIKLKKKQKQRIEPFHTSYIALCWAIGFCAFTVKHQ